MVDSVLLELVDFLMQEFTASSGVVFFFFSDMDVLANYSFWEEAEIHGNWACPLFGV